MTDHGALMYSMVRLRILGRLQVPYLLYSVVEQLELGCDLARDDVGDEFGANGVIALVDVSQEVVLADQEWVASALNLPHNVSLVE